MRDSPPGRFGVSSSIPVSREAERAPSGRWRWRYRRDQTKHRDTDALPTCRARRVRPLARDQRASERGRMLAVLDKQGFQALECTLAPGEADAVDGEIVDETRVEIVLGVAGARLRHTR